MLFVSLRYLAAAVADAIKRHGDGRKQNQEEQQRRRWHRAIVVLWHLWAMVTVVASLATLIVALVNLQELSESVLPVLMTEYPMWCDNHALCIDPFYNMVWQMGMGSVTSALLSVIIIARMLRCPCFGSTYAMQFSSISPRSSFSHAYSSLLLENHQHDEEKLTTKMPDPTPLPTKRRWKEPILDCYLLLHQASLVLGQAGILGLYSCGLNLIACAFRLVLIVFFAN